MKNISLVVNARVNSTRIPRKIVRPFCQTTLLENMLDKLENLSGVSKYLAAGDKEITDLYERKYSNSSISLLKRSEDSVKQGLHKHSVSFKHYFELETDYIMSVNPCLPFVKCSTYKKAIDHFFKINCRTMTSVRSSGNIFFNSHHQVLNSPGDVIISNNDCCIYEMAHAFHIFDKDYFQSTGMFWDYSEGHPAIFSISDLEAVDIDVPLDFAVAEALFKEIKNAKNKDFSSYCK